MKNMYHRIDTTYPIPNYYTGIYDYSSFIPREGSRIPSVPDDEDEDDDDWDEDYDFEYRDYDYNTYR